jgi:hypothetical protein
MVTLPKIKNPIRKRDNGETEFAGLTPIEACKACGALLAVWAVTAAFTAVMFVIARAVRSSHDVLQRPGSPIA